MYDSIDLNTIPDEMVGDRLLKKAFINGMENDWIHGKLLKGGSPQTVYEAVSSPNYVYGSRLRKADGRVFVYAKATNIISDIRFGLKFWAELVDGIPYTAPLQTEDADSLTIQIDSGKGSAGVDENELAGGWLIVHTGTDYESQFRRVVSNTIADGDGYVTLTVDGPFNCDIETGYGVEVCPNPYASVRLSSSGGGAGGTPSEWSSVAGIPGVKTSKANMSMWLQTWGPCWVNPHGTAAATPTADRRQVVFDREGSISAVDESVSSDVCQQIAGFLIGRESSGNGTGPPLLMLQISP